MLIEALPAFSDNYIWLLSDQHCNAVVVDPGDATVVIAALSERNLQLSGVLITHHHFDHTGGVQALLEHASVPVIGPEASPFEHINRIVTEGECIPVLDRMFQVIKVPGHTLDHIAYYDAKGGHLFCGDTLFSGGCGRVFEGTFEQMQSSLSKLRELPEDTRVYAAHEYTANNLKFALAVEPDNTQLAARVAEVRQLRAVNTPTLPTTLGVEKATNPFLRWDSPAVIAAANSRRQGASNESIFQVIREWKDSF